MIKLGQVAEKFLKLLRPHQSYPPKKPRLSRRRCHV